jgi:hypothetical protein
VGRRGPRRPTPVIGYATFFFFRHAITLIIFSDSLNSNKTEKVIVTPGSLSMYFNGPVIKNTDGGISVINLNGV